MKKIFYVMCAIAMMVACAKVTPDASNDVQNAISFSAFNYLAQTKAEDNDGKDHLEFYANGTFNVVAYYTEDSWNSVEEDLSNAILYMDNASVSKSGSEWKTASAYYWPKVGKVSFFGYYPASIADYTSMSSKTAGIEIKDYTVKALAADQATLAKDNNDENDVMLADPAIDKTQNVLTHFTEGVSMLFRHKLAKVKFGSKAISSGEVPGITFKVVINGISINDIYNNGSYDGSLWTVAGKPEQDSGNIFSSDYAPAKGDTFDNTAAGVLGDSYAAMGSDYYVLPQDLADGSYVNLSYTIYAIDESGKILNQKSYDVNVTLNEIESANKGAIDSWDINKIYSYNFAIDTFGDEILFDPAIVDWEKDSSADQDGEKDEDADDDDDDQKQSGDDQDANDDNDQEQSGDNDDQNQGGNDDQKGDNQDGDGKNNNGKGNDNGQDKNHNKK